MGECKAGVLFYNGEPFAEWQNMTLTYPPMNRKSFVNALVRDGYPRKAVKKLAWRIQQEKVPYREAYERYASIHRRS